MKDFIKPATHSIGLLFILLAFASCGSGQSAHSQNDSVSPASLSTGTTPPAGDSGTPADPGTPAEPVPATNPTPAATPVSSVPVPAPAPAEGSVPPAEGNGTSQAPKWQLLGGRVNASQRGVAVWLTLATVQGTPVVAWEEDGKIYAAFWNGTRWNEEGPLNADPAEAASLPALAADGQGLFLTWIEGRSLHLVRREGSGWAPVAVQSSQSECGPVNAGLEVRQGVPILAWDSFCSDSRYASTRVQQWAGAWVDLGGVGEHYADAPSPRKYALGSNDQNLSLAVLMQNASSEGIELALFHHAGGSWLPDGGPANDPLTFNPSAFSLAFVQERPTLAFQQEGIQAKQWNGEAWVRLGGPLSQDGVDPALLGVDASPTLAFSGPRVEVWSWNGSQWAQKGTALNQIPGSFSWSTALATSGRQLYTAWIENGFVFVKSLATQ
ncbi:MAG: hypothetical protein EPO39_15660 [Candidatus Manganitrophaceae bacterium]|nr:MAG: hypothetical protein EPO39_15660 [Candidatus Manganitrophaceae bacterium]